jgi:hypothetical protein
MERKRMNEDVRISASEAWGRPTPVLTAGAAELDLSRPVMVDLLGTGAEALGYDEFTGSGDGSWRGTFQRRFADGSVVAGVDHWSPAGPGTARLHRTIEVLEQGSAEGIRIGLSATTVTPGDRDEDWQYFIPSTLYNRNDNDGDGVEDYLGTYVQDHRDDKNGCLAVLAHLATTGSTFAITRADAPAFDTAVTEDQLRQRFFVQSTDIGSLGTAPAGNGEVELRASWPFSEEVSFCLDTDGTGWAGYAPNATGRILDIRYEFRLTSHPGLTEAIWDVFEHQRRQLRTAARPAAVSLGESLQHRQLLSQLYYRGWTKEENPKEPAGYLVHFSPRRGETQGSLLEFGFSGDQTLVAFAQLKYGYDTRTPLYRDRARSVIDFFVTHCQLENGYSHGIYDPINDRFTYWFTGILMPFQYATTEDEVRHFVGRQIASALLPIAAELRTVEGNYLRTMCESMYPTLLAYELDREEGVEQGHWLEAGIRFGEFLLRVQGADGSWFRAYDTAGNGLTSPAQWFGRSETEQKSGTIFPIPVLTVLHRLTGDRRYLDAIRNAADYLIARFVQPVAYVGGLNDTTHIKSVKTDAVGVMFLMRSLLFAFEVLGDRGYLDAAVSAARILASWVYLWDVPFPPDSLLGRSNFRSTGWAGCDVIASGSYLDDEFLEFVGDLVLVADYANEPALAEIAELVEYGMQHAVSTPQNMLGYVAAGIQCEGILTSYWLSAPDETAFSGAVNKVKGDDNDTCNALINAQAAYGLYDLERHYGTWDFGVIRARIGSGAPGWTGTRIEATTEGTWA